MKALTGQGTSQKMACRILGVSTRGYRLWLRRPPCQMRLRHQMLAEMITQIHVQSRGCYGKRRMWAELTMGMGLQVGREQVGAIMKTLGLRGLSGTRKRYVNRDYLVTHEDLVQRNFTASAPNQLWCTDITEHATKEGKLYICCVIDVFSRKIVGWAIESRQTTALVLDALDMAISNRKPHDTIIHSDHGTQFTSWAFTNRIKEAGLVGSMGTIGDGYDNALIESFWGKMQVELLNRQEWTTRTELAGAVFDYIEIYHNRWRRHSAIGNHTPVEYEQQHPKLQIAS